MTSFIITCYVCLVDIPVRSAFFSREIEEEWIWLEGRSRRRERVLVVEGGKTWSVCILYERINNKKRD